MNSARKVRNWGLALEIKLDIECNYYFFLCWGVQEMTFHSVKRSLMVIRTVRGCLNGFCHWKTLSSVANKWCNVLTTSGEYFVFQCRYDALIILLMKSIVSKTVLLNFLGFYWRQSLSSVVTNWETNIYCSSTNSIHEFELFFSINFLLYNWLI